MPIYWISKSREELRAQSNKSMADIIDKIGKYFAEQEAQLRQVYVQANTHVALPPTSTHRGSSAKPHSHQQPPSRQQPVVEIDTLPGRNSSKEHQPPSLLRRRLLLQSAQSSEVKDTASSLCPPLRTPTTLIAAAGKPAPPVVVPPLAFASPFSNIKQRASVWNASEDAWSEINGDDGFASWRSARSSHDARAPAISQVDSPAAQPEMESSDNNDQESQASNNGKSSLTKPRKISLRRRGAIKKKRRSSSSKHLPTELDPEQVKREKEHKVAAALVLAQERAKRIQIDRKQQLKGRELASHNEERRVQDEMEKIEAIRLKSKQFALRLRPSSASVTPGALSSSGSFSSRSTKLRLESDLGHSSSNNSNNSNSERPDHEDTVTVESPKKSSSGFLDKMERQVRDQMVIELRIRKRALAKQQAQEHEWQRVSSQIDKQDDINEKKQQRLTTLEVSKQSLEREFAKIQEQLQNSRSQRLALEEISRRDRTQRQRDAERVLRARVRIEERNRLLDEEKARSEVAAGARERASQRVVSRASSLKKMLLHSNDDIKDSQRANRSNNNNHEDDREELSVHRTSVRDTKPRAALLFAPELAEFEEEGLLDDAYLAEPAQQVAVCSESAHDATTAFDETVDNPHDEAEQVELSVPETSSLRVLEKLASSFSEPAEPKFEWRVPPFEDRALFNRVVLHDLLSDSDEVGERFAN